MSELGYNFNQLIITHKEGSHSTRAARKATLNLCAKELTQLGYKLKSPKGLKTKHINALVNKWTNDSLSNKTIKNRLSSLRWVANKIGKSNIVLRTNDEYGLAKVQSCPFGKSKKLDLEKLENIKDQHLRFSLRLQEAFGLRREEAIKFKPSYAIQKDHLRLKGSWTKGGKPRKIAITNVQQQQLLKEISKFTKGSLIPANLNYKQQLTKYERETAKVGLSKNHGLRHHYARERYLHLTGWKCPADGGPKRRSLGDSDRAIDFQARMQISKELGHERFNISYTYLGS